MNRISKYGLAALMLPLLLLYSLWAVSQDDNSTDKIESMKIAFITKALDLTPKESQVFWPIYNQYTKELALLRKQRKENLHDSKKNMDKLTEAELAKAIEDNFMNEQKELELKRKYFLEYKKILPIKKIAKLYRAEKQFTLLVLKEYQK